ncbi:hypothetical protein [Microlunatus sp. GCM10028923]|uniref:hypothetical protein n=1 Tax=Microlunatus sp. GCM10028923 TaxID=3273400 RepID=UPI00361B6410
MTVDPALQVSGAPAVAPPAPGRLGEPLPLSAAAKYVEALGRWRDGRRLELDQLDRAALQGAAQQSAGGSIDVTHDITLSMALWKAASDRYELLRATWDGGRAGEAERERMATLIWGRLDATVDPALLARAGSSGLAVSLPEACRLSDALAGQLRERLALETSGLEVAERIRQLRIQLERIRDQVGLEPAGAGQQQLAGQQARLGRRLKEIGEKAARGGDVGGLLGPIEIEVATFERDLIVAAATRREAGAKVDQARDLLAELTAREQALRTLVRRCVETVDPAPHYAVPEVSALGPVPNTLARLDPFLERLGKVSQAMNVVADAYTGALRDHEELVGRLDAFRAKATSLGHAGTAELQEAYRWAEGELNRGPARLRIARQLVELYQSYLEVQAPRRSE